MRRGEPRGRLAVKRRPKCRPQQRELSIDGGFQLIAETADDGERIAKERQDEKQQRQAAESAQTTLF